MERVEFDIDLSEFPESYGCEHQFAESIWPEAFYAIDDEVYRYTYGFEEYNNAQFKNPPRNFSSDIELDSCSRRRINPFSQNNQILKRSQLSLPFDHVGQSTTTTTSGINYNYKWGSVSSGKTRIRWSEDLHDRFVDCVNQLGGPDKATPKAILKLMQQDNQELTILHIKSHLQKYRNVKYVPESVEEGLGISNNKTCVAQIDTKTGMQLKEALQLQVDVQKRLHEQLEIQNKLQLRIEEQGKKLKMMIEEQHKNLKSA